MRKQFSERCKGAANLTSCVMGAPSGNTRLVSGDEAEAPTRQFRNLRVWKWGSFIREIQGQQVTG